MQREATNPLTRLFNLGLACLAILLIAGCGGGGGGGSDGSPSSSGKATLRFMQAGASLGTSQFTVQGTTTPVAFRELSAGVSVDAGTVTISATAPGTQVAVIPALTISINEGDTGIVVLNQRESELPRLVLAGTLGTGSAGSTVSYAHFAPFQPILDIYVLAGGQTLAAASPIATGLRTNEVTPAVSVSGQYQVIATTPGRKDRIVYQSEPQTAVSGSPTIFLGAQWTFESLQPQPIAVSRAGAVVVDDPRPVVRTLTSYQFLKDRIIKLYVDCDQPVVLLPYLNDVVAPKYRVTPGTRSVSPACTPLGPGTGNTGTVDTVFFAEQGRQYVQPYRPSVIVPTSLEIQAIGWVAPFITTDFPVPANKARVRIAARNSLRPGDIYVNGSLLEANVEIKELVVDVNPGNLSVLQLMPGTSRSEGGITFTVFAGHYYYIEIGHFTTAEDLATVIYPQILAGQPVGRVFLVNSDD